MTSCTVQSKRQAGELPSHLAELRAALLASGWRPVRPGECSPEPVGADREPGDLNGDGQ